MLAKERHSAILALLQEKGAVTVTALSKKLMVSAETVRRDLLEMEKSHLLQRVHGGAVTRTSMTTAEDLPHRLEINKDAKIALCKTAASLVRENDFIAVDCGSTAVYFAEILHQRFNTLTVVTHSTDVANILADKSGFRVILCGGRYRKEEKAVCGPLTIQMLQNLHVQKAFLFPAAVSLSHGVSNFDADLTAVQQEMRRIADTCYFLADNEKFEKTALYKLCDTQDAAFVSSPTLAQRIKKTYRDNGVTIITEEQELAQ